MSLPGDPALDRAYHPGAVPVRLVRAEIMKIRTTSIWWLFLLGVVVFTAGALWANAVSHHLELYPPLGALTGAARAQAIAQAARARTHSGQVAIAASMMTSGQFLGVLFAMLIGVLVITSEFAHQTATATFLATPRRAVVITAKLAAAAWFGALFWLVSTVMDAVITPFYLHSQHVSVSLTGWVVVRSVLLSLLAFAIWACFGLGLGALIRSQTGSVITGMAVYLAGLAAAEITFHLIYNFYPHGWVLGAPVIGPAVASTVMITPGRAFAHAPPQWAGLVIMVGYAAALGVSGIAVTRRHDVT